MYFWQAHDFPENQSRGSYYAESHRQQAVSLGALSALQRSENSTTSKSAARFTAVKTIMMTLFTCKKTNLSILHFWRKVMGRLHSILNVASMSWSCDMPLTSGLCRGNKDPQFLHCRTLHMHVNVLLPFWKVFLTLQTLSAGSTTTRTTTTVANNAHYNSDNHCKDEHRLPRSLYRGLPFFSQEPLDYIEKNPGPGTLSSREFQG